MKYLVSLFFVLMGFAAIAQEDKAANYIATYKDIAVAEMKRSGVPAAITLAQGMLESGYGQSDLCSQSNNHFGIKCKEEWTGERVFHDDDTKNECFRKYADATLSYQDHSNFLKTRAHYDFLFQLDPTDYESWAKGLKKAGYATEKDYPQKLIRVIRDYNLNQYTLIALQKTDTPIDLALNSTSTTTTSFTTKPSINNKTAQDTEVLGELIIPITAKKLRQAAAQNALAKEAEDKDTALSTVATAPVKPLDAPVEVATNKYPEGIFVINHSKVVYAKEGTSLLSLALKYDITLSKLLEFNDITDTEILTADKLIYLEKKSKKGAVDFHVVAPKENLYDISQNEGVRLESVLEYNNLKKEAQPAEGSKIYLRAPATVVTLKSLASGTF